MISNDNVRLIIEGLVFSEGQKKTICWSLNIRSFFFLKNRKINVFTWRFWKKKNVSIQRWSIVSLGPTENFKLMKRSFSVRMVFRSVTALIKFRWFDQQWKWSFFSTFSNCLDGLQKRNNHVDESSNLLERFIGSCNFFLENFLMKNKTSFLVFFHSARIGAQQNNIVWKERSQFYFEVNWKR